jgi:glycosyltransferase involved in cell wall biosynthesis
VTSPSISVVIPTYNCAVLLPKAIRSAYAQTIAPIQVIVVDDGCTDDTGDVVGRLAGSLPDTFTFIRKPNGGEASARNCGVAAATGEYVAFLDQDDMWLPNKFERQLALFQSTPSPSLVFTALTRVSRDTREPVRIEGWKPDPVHTLARLMEGCCVTPSTVIVRRDALTAVGPFDESLWLGNDWDMWLRLAVAGHRFAYLDEPLTEYLWHTTNMSRDKRKIADAALTILPRHFAAGTLPAPVQTLERSCLARWNLIAACYALAAGQNREVRQHLVTAIRTRPASLRGGWLLLFFRSLRESLTAKLGLSGDHPSC